MSDNYLYTKQGYQRRTQAGTGRSKEECRLTVKTLVKTSEYHDSVSLMLVARELSGMAGVKDAAVVMGTEANKSILEQSGLLTPEAQAASPNDLVIAVQFDGDDDGVLEEAEKLLNKKQSAEEAAEFRPKTCAVQLRTARMPTLRSSQ
jgi:hypothetical protein